MKCPSIVVSVKSQITAVLIALIFTKVNNVTTVTNLVTSIKIALAVIMVVTPLPTRE
jgi:hypothetical protein